MMTDEQIQRLQALKVTGGEWFLYGPLSEEESSVVGGVPPKIVAMFPEIMDEGEQTVDLHDECRAADFELMAHAKLLLEEVVRLRSALPRTADGVSIVPGMKLFKIDDVGKPIAMTVYRIGELGSMYWEDHHGRQRHNLDWFSSLQPANAAEQGK